MSTVRHRRRKFLGASIALIVLSPAGVSAFTSDSTVQSPGAANEGIRRSTTTMVPRTIPKCYGGSNCTPRVKNGVVKLTTTIVPKAPTICRGGSNCKPKVKNGLIPRTTTTVPSTIAKPCQGGKGCYKPKKP